MKFEKGQKFTVNGQVYVVISRTKCYIMFECNGDTVKRRITSGDVESCKPDGKTVIAADSITEQTTPVVVSRQDRKGKAEVNIFDNWTHAVAWVMIKAKNISGEFIIQPEMA